MKINNNTEGLDKHRNVFVRGVCSLSILSGWIAAAMILAAVLITCQMLFVRSVLNESTIWQTEAVIYLMISATLLGLPYVQLLRGHVNVDLVPMMLSPFWRRCMYFITLLFSFAIVAVMAIYAYEHWYIAFERQWRSDTVWGIRLWIPYLALPIGFFLLCLQLFADFIAVCIGEDKPYGLEEK